VLDNQGMEILQMIDPKPAKQTLKTLFNDLLQSVFFDSKLFRVAGKERTECTRVNSGLPGKYAGRPENIFQFADIPGPGVILKKGHRTFGDAHIANPPFTLKFFQDIPCDVRQIALPFSQRGNVKSAPPQLFGQIPMKSLAPSGAVCPVFHSENKPGLEIKSIASPHL